MWADIIKASPLVISVLPEHQTFAKKLDSIWLVGFQILDKGHRVPLFGPRIAGTAV